MCIICIDLDRKALRPFEARRALGEMREKLTPEHVAEVEAKLAQAERDAADEAPVVRGPNPPRK